MRSTIDAAGGYVPQLAVKWSNNKSYIPAVKSLMTVCLYIMLKKKKKKPTD